jgi:hypothetical protein
MEPVNGTYHNPSGADVSFEIGQRPWDPPVVYTCKAGGFMEGPLAYAAAFRRIAGLVLVTEEEAAIIKAAAAKADVKADTRPAKADAKAAKVG